MTPIEWITREEPLEPVAVAAGGSVARRLLRRLLARQDEEVSQLKGLASDNLVLVLGATTRLPWVPGCHYLGKDPEAPSLLLPTHSRPNLDAALLEQALRARYSAMPLAVLPSLSLLISASGALHLDRAFLQAWLDRNA